MLYFRTLYSTFLHIVLQPGFIIIYLLADPIVSELMEKNAKYIVEWQFYLWSYTSVAMNALEQ